MELLSVNVSQAVDIEYNGKRVSSSIFKKPVSGKVAVAEFNLAGDKQVDLENHGGGHKAVYAFSADEYDYWAQTLNRDDLHFGQFGENLTISNLDEAQLCIGDHLQVGSCILEISQPRVPCFKLGIAFDLSTMPKQFVQHAATGIYFKVVQAGELATGDTVELVYSHPQKLPVQTLFRAYFDSTVSNAKEIMLLAESIDALSDEWRKKVVKKLNLL